MIASDCGIPVVSGGLMNVDQVPKAQKKSNYGGGGGVGSSYEDKSGGDGATP